MKKVVPIFLIMFLFLSVDSFSQIKLHVPEETPQEYSIFRTQKMESNFNLTVPADATSMPNFDLVKGLWIIGAALDYTLPMGEDFKNFADPGFSGDLFVGYMITKLLMISFRAGYVSFGEVDFSNDPNFSNTWSHSQIPLLLGLSYYILHQQKLRLYVGLYLGLYLLMDSFKISYPGLPSQEGDESTSKFGISPQLGMMYLVSTSLAVHFAINYAMIFHKAEENVDNSANLSEISLMLGVAFAISEK